MSRSTPNYRIKIAGHLTPNWGERLGGLEITIEAKNSVLLGYIKDQAALHGLLQQIRDLGFTLLLVEKLEAHNLHIDLKEINQ